MVLEDKYAKYYDTTLIMLEKAINLAIALFLVKCRFQNHRSDGKHNAKVRTVN